MNNKIKPVFNKKLPKDFYKYFNVESDYEFMQQHPIAYKILLGIGMFVLFLPMIIYFVFEYSTFPTLDNPWILLGYLGSFITGIGLFNIVAAYVNQYLGHMVTFITIFGGIAMMVISWVMVYSS